MTGISYLEGSSKIPKSLRVEAPGAAADRPPALPAPISDPVAWSSAGAREIGFDLPERYNASEVLFHNLSCGNGDRPAVTGPAGTQSYAQLARSSAQWGHGLLALGLRRGDRLLLMLDDIPAYPAAFFGAVRAGLVPILINPLTPPEHLRFYLGDSQARGAVVEAPFHDRFAAACSGLGSPPRLIVVDGATTTARRGKTVTGDNWLAQFPVHLPAADTHRNDMAFWMYSSGSTGKPKGIVHLQHDMAYTHCSYARSVLKLTADDICFSVSKIFFSYGFGNSITFPFAVGATSVLLPGRPTPDAVFAAVKVFRPTVFFGVPTLYTLLANAPDFATARFSSVRLAVSAAEILPTDLAKTWRASTGLDIVECLGSTEMLNVYLSNTSARKKPGSSGLRVPGYEIVLKNDRGSPAADGQVGTMWIRGQSGTPMFWNDPERTARTISEDGWYCTGDRFTRDSDGFYFFRGRTDDLIRIAGQAVSPVEVQSCLAEHPGIRECAVLSTRLSDGRNVLKAFVVMKRAAFDPASSRSQLRDYVKRKLLPFKCPYLIEFLPELPKTGSGKIDRQSLMNRAGAEPGTAPATGVTKAAANGAARGMMERGASRDRANTASTLAGRGDAA